MRTLEIRRRRAEEANRVIAAIASTGRRFFYNAKDDRLARLEVDAVGRVWLIDEAVGARVDINQPLRWRGFSHGSTLKGIVAALRRYVVAGELVHPGYFGPWASMGPDADLWGYGPVAMAAVRAAVLESAAVSKPAAVAVKGGSR
ncbi:hypothetical protein D3C72_1135110 [compost metagenome]